MIRLFPHRIRTWTDRLRRLSAADVLQLVKALGVTLGVWTALRLVAVRRVLAWTEVRASTERQLPDARRERILWAVAAVNRRLFPDRPCLTQALAARYLLARNGVPSTFRIGVTRDEAASLQAHAWLEQDGEVLIGGRESPSAYHLLRSGESPADQKVDRAAPRAQEPPRLHADSSPPARP